MGSFIDLGSILSAFSSSGGINVQAAVAQALAAEAGPLNEWQQEQALIQSQTSDIHTIEGNLTTLENALQSLGDPAGSLMAMTATSSDSGVVTAAAANGAASGNHVLEVDSVATTGSWYSDAVATGDTALPDGGFTLQVGANTPIQIPIGGNVDTLNQLSTYINGLNAGVTANVVTDSNGARLSIVSNASGAANDITISGETGLNFTQATIGADASLKVDGIPIDSASNTVTGVIPGVTFNLVSANPKEQVNVAIASDSNAITQSITSFVNAYNAVIGNVNQEFTVGANGVQGPLAGDSTLRMLQDMMLGSGSYQSNSGTGISTLADLGITMNDDGTLSVDNSTLASAVSTNFAGVQNFIQGTSSNGFAAFLNNQLNTMTDATSGAFTVDLQSLNNENSDLQDEINNFQDWLQSEQTRLTNEYNQVAATLQQLPILEKQIQSELANIGSNTGSGS